MLKEENKIIEEAISLIGKVLGVSKESIKSSDKIIDLCKDSIQLFELIVAFENTFNIETTYKDLVNLETVQDIIDYLKRYKSL